MVGWVVTESLSVLFRKGILSLARIYFGFCKGLVSMRERWTNSIVPLVSSRARVPISPSQRSLLPKGGKNSLDPNGGLIQVGLRMNT